MSNKLTWLITGASNGLGAALALECLRQGHRVVGAARNVAKARGDHPDVEARGGKWLLLDVTQPDTEAVVRRAVEAEGVDVVVNNAGYGARGVLEDLSMADVRAQFETNVFGAVAVTKGAIPVFRERGRGTIVNVSSTSGMGGNPSSSVYAASKFALEGLTESLSGELREFGIRSIIVQPGGYRTDFQVNLGRPKAGKLSAPYQGSVAHKTMDRLEGGHGKQPGDPVKAAQAIIEVVTGEGRGKNLAGVQRLALGNDAADKMRWKIGELTKDIEKTESLSRWAVYDE